MACLLLFVFLLLRVNSIEDKRRALNIRYVAALTTKLDAYFVFNISIPSLPPAHRRARLCLAADGMVLLFAAQKGGSGSGGGSGGGTGTVLTSRYAIGVRRPGGSNSIHVKVRVLTTVFKAYRLVGAQATEAEPTENRPSPALHNRCIGLVGSQSSLHG
jgi:hypothetical protein